MTSSAPKPKTFAIGSKFVVTPEVEAAIEAFVAATITTGIDNLKQEYMDLNNSSVSAKAMQKSIENNTRNRASRPCLDATRVVLTHNVPPDTDYIHANRITMKDVDRVFIATQAPMESTVQDFWRLVFQENAAFIWMLCKSGGREPCPTYFPMQNGAYGNFGSFTITTKQVEKDEGGHFVIYSCEVLPEGCSNANYVKIMNVTDWPESRFPGSSMSILRLIRTSMANLVPGPEIVHCVGGFGPTGAVIAIETALHRLFKGISVSLPELVNEMRSQRPGIVDNEKHYLCVYTVIMLYIGAKIPKYKEASKIFTVNVRNST